MTDSVWDYQAASGHQAGTDLTGFKVEAIDGSIGKVDKHSDDVGAAHIVVDTGVWIFGKHVLLPVGTISSIDVAEQRIYVDRTKDEIKNSPSSTRTSTPATPATTSRSAATTGRPTPDPRSVQALWPTPGSHRCRPRAVPGRLTVLARGTIRVSPRSPSASRCRSSC